MNNRHSRLFAAALIAVSAAVCTGVCAFAADDAFTAEQAHETEQKDIPGITETETADEVSVEPSETAGLFADSNGLTYTLNESDKTASVGGLKRDYNTSGYSSSDGNLSIPLTVTFGGTSYKVTGIESYAFAYCKDLKSITLKYNMAKIGSGAFAGCENLTRISLSPSSNTSFKAASDGTYLCNKSGDTLIVYADGTGRENFSIPSGIKTIAAGAFEGTANLKTLNVSGIEKIEPFAFADSSIKSLVCSADAIEDGTFAQSKIECVAIMSGSLDKIGRAAFYNCKNLKTLIIPGVEVLSEDALYGCSALERIVFATAPGEIKDGAFYGIPSSCKLVYKTGSTVFDSYKSKFASETYTSGSFKYQNSVSGAVVTGEAFLCRRADNSSGVDFAVYNGTDAAENVTAYVAFYTDDNRMCGAAVTEPAELAAYESHTFSVSTPSEFSRYKVILLDENLSPLGIALGDTAD